MECPHSPLLCVQDFNSYLTDLIYFVTEIVHQTSVTLSAPINLLLLDHCAQWFLHSSAALSLLHSSLFRQVIIVNNSAVTSIPSLELLQRNSSGILSRIFSALLWWFPLQRQSHVSPPPHFFRPHDPIHSTVTDTALISSVFLSSNSDLFLHSSDCLLFPLPVHELISRTLLPLSSVGPPATKRLGLELLECHPLRKCHSLIALLSLTSRDSK